MNWKSVFYGKLTRTTTPKILSVVNYQGTSLQCKKKHLQGSFFIINLYSSFDFFINYEKNCLAACSLVV